MATRRMFNTALINSDPFLDLPLASQALYFHLIGAADDDGFVDSVNSKLRSLGCSTTELEALVEAEFVHLFESRVLVILHWKLHNQIKKDRYHSTVHLSEKDLLSVSEDGTYFINGSRLYPDCLQSGSNLETSRSPSGTSMEPEPSKVQISQVEDIREPTQALTPSLEDVKNECVKQGYSVDPQRFYEINESKGWLIGTTPIRDWRILLKSWNSREKAEKRQTPPTKNRFCNFPQRRYNDDFFSELERLEAQRNEATNRLYIDSEEGKKERHSVKDPY